MTHMLVLAEQDNYEHKTLAEKNTILLKKVEILEEQLRIHEQSYNCWQPLRKYLNIYRLSGKYDGMHFAYVAITLIEELKQRVCNNAH